jgi:peptidoglycan hydrolase CwlO-like protein
MVEAKASPFFDFSKIQVYYCYNFSLMSTYTPFEQEVLTSIKSLDQKVSSLDQKVSSLDQKVSSLDQKVSSLESEMKA